MAKKSMIVKANKPGKFKVQELTRCSRCGRPHSVLRKFKLCRICFRELAYKGQMRALKKQAGKLIYIPKGLTQMQRARHLHHNISYQNHDFSRNAVKNGGARHL